MITARCFSPTMRLRVLSALLLVAPIVRGHCPPPATLYVPRNGLVTSETHIHFHWSPSGPSPSRVKAPPLPGPSASIVTGPLVRSAPYSWRVRASRGSTCPAPQVSNCPASTVRRRDPPSPPSPAQPPDGATNQPRLLSF